MNHNVSAGGNAKFFGIFAVLQVGVRNAQREMIGAVGVVVCDVIATFRCFGIAFALFVPQRIAPKRNFVCFDDLSS